MIKPQLKEQDGLKENIHAKERQLIITRRNGKMVALLLEDGILIKAASSSGNDLEEGSICLGKVSELKPEIGSAFLMVRNKQKCFIGINELSSEFNLTSSERSVKCGDNFLIQIKKSPSKGKLSTATTKLKGYSAEEILDLKTNAMHLVDFSVIKDEKYHFIELCIGYNTDFPKRIVTDLSDEKDGIDKYLQAKYPDVYSGLDFYCDKMVSLSVIYGIEGKLSEALEKKVWLKSGAYLIIEHTEAMTVIDVNSGKASFKGENDEVVYKLNLEAAKEVARQIVLRNLSGIIIVDFVNMKNNDNKKELMEFVQQNLNLDSVPARVVDMTKLDLMEITRKKENKTLFEQFLG